MSISPKYIHNIFCVKYALFYIIRTLYLKESKRRLTVTVKLPEDLKQATLLKFYIEKFESYQDVPLWRFGGEPRTLYRKSDLYSKKFNGAAPFNIPTFMERFIYYINRSQKHECGNLETECYNSVLEITRLHSAQFQLWEYIYRNQTFILDSHRGPSFAVQNFAHFKLWL